MKLVCKILFIVCLVGNLNAQTTAVPKTYGQQVYPNSGSTRSRSNVMGGRAISASKASDSSEESPEKASSSAQKQEEQDNEFEVGPYDQEGNYKYFNPED